MLQRVFIGAIEILGENLYSKIKCPRRACAVLSNSIGKNIGMKIVQIAQ